MMESLHPLPYSLRYAPCFGIDAPVEGISARVTRGYDCGRYIDSSSGAVEGSLLDVWIGIPVKSEMTLATLRASRTFRKFPHMAKIEIETPGFDGLAVEAENCHAIV